MDYKKYKCPVCDKPFQDGDDIVVCPECGTPHHRECYEIENRCANESMHKDGFEFCGDKSNNESHNNNTNNNTDENTVICPKCKAVNDKSMFYCGKCGYPIVNQNNQSSNNQYYNPYGNNQYNNQYNNQDNTGGMPFGNNPFNMGVNPFDPMGGVNPDYEIDENVTAGDAAKYVQKNTPYFVRIFYNIKEFNKSRINLCAFLFSGGYLLYRKMYKIGAFITALMVALMITQIYVQFTPAFTQFWQAIENASNTTGIQSYTEYYRNVAQAYLNLSLSEQLLIFTSSICSIAQFAIKIIVALKANRWYFKHTTKEIKRIKSQEAVDFKAEIETKGGINTALAISMLVVYIIISYLPMLLSIYFR